MKSTGLILTLFILGSAWGCTRRASSGHPIPDSGTGKRKVQAVTVRTVSVPAVVESFGSLAPVSKIDITASVEGTVRKPAAEEGARVKRGDILLRLENLQLRIRERQARTAVEKQRAACALAEAAYWEGKLQVEARLLSLTQLKKRLRQREDELKELQRELENKTRLFELGGISEEEYRKANLSYRSAVTEFENLELDVKIKQIGFRDEDILAREITPPTGSENRKRVFQEINNLTLKAEMDAARAGLASAEAEWESLKLLLAKLEVRSPAEGIAGPRHVEQGERVALGDELMYIFPDELLHVVFHVQEDAAPLIRKGQEIRVSIPGLEEGESGSGVRPGKVDIVSPVVDPVSGNVLVKGILRNGSGKLKPGMFARVRVECGEPELRITVPENCLLSHEDGRGIVFAVKNGRAFPVSIRTGEKENGTFEVAAGLEPGDAVVVSPPPGLQEGEEVDVLE
jgi:RND family efflux transporter MFP subunit